MGSRIFENEPEMPTITNEKPSLPTLWVDTAIGIKLAKVQQGEAIQDVEKSRMVKLKELVAKLARNCKLLCPEGEQQWEYWGTRLDDKIAGEFAALSRGIRMLPYQAIHDSQLAASPFTKRCCCRSARWLVIPSPHSLTRRSGCPRIRCGIHPSAAPG